MRSRKSLIAEADRLCSIYTRNRGATSGYNHCYTCGRYLPVDVLQAGHFVARRYLNTRWHGVNVWPQCNTCNVEKHGNLKVYELKLSHQFSPDVVDELWDLARNQDPITDDEINNIIKSYKNVDSPS